MTIRNPKLFMEGFWDWGFLDICFSGSKAKVSDIDGILERNGHFLALETKGEGVPIPAGQNILYRKLNDLGVFTVIYVWGTRNNVTKLKVFYPNGHKQTLEHATNEDLIDIVGRWWKFVNEYSVRIEAKYTKK